MFLVWVQIPKFACYICLHVMADFGITTLAQDRKG